MDQIAIALFKATCLSVLERVRKTRKPILVTRFGKPVAEIFPPTEPPRQEHWMGSLAGTLKVTGNLVEPVSPESDWDAA